MEAGYKEIVLTGIHTGGYGEDFEDYKLSDLLWYLDKVEGLKRIRISSIEASQIDDRVIDVLNKSDKMCRHLHIPLQAGDDAVLKRMRRRYTVDEYRRKIRSISTKAMPGVAITSDVIVGFPGETEEQFENGYCLIEELGFSELHVFPYSTRTGTPAARMPDQVPAEVKQERVARLIALSDHLAMAYASKFAGEVLEVIPAGPIEKEDPDSGWMVGYSDNYLQIAFSGNKELVGQVCRVRLDQPGSEYSQGTFVRTMDEVPRPYAG